MNKNKKIVRSVVVAIVAIIMVLVGGLYLASQDSSGRTEKPDVKLKVRAKRAKMERPTLRKTEKSKRGAKPKLGFNSAEHPYSEKDKMLAKAMQEALDADNYDAVLRTTASALKSDNPDVRLNAVEALGWYGKQTLPELTVCMADADEDVAQAAINHWEEGVSDIDDPNEKLQISLYAINTIADEDALTMIGSHFASAAMNIIDGEDDADVAAQKRLEIIQALAEVIEGENEKGANSAREAYEEITGSKWINVSEAEKYLADPDNYEEPATTNEQ